MKCLFVLTWYFFFFFLSLAAKLIGPRKGCQFFKKKSIFSSNTPLNELMASSN